MEGEPFEDMLLRKGILTPVTQVVSHMKKTAASYSLPFGDIKKNYNSRLIQEVGLWAQENDQGPAFQAEGFKTNFVKNDNLADTEVLLKLVQDIGLDPIIAKSVIADRLYSDAVDADWAAVQEFDIVAAPTYIVDTERLVGAQSYHELETLVVNHGATHVSTLSKALR